MPAEPDFNHAEYWHQRAKETRRLAKRMIDKTARQTMLVVAEDCDRFAVKAAVCSIEGLAVRRVIDEMKGS
jgi:hypothetical protein